MKRSDSLIQSNSLGFEDAEDLVVQMPWGPGFQPVPVRVVTKMDALIEEYALGNQATGTPFGSVLWPSSLAFMRFWEDAGFHSPSRVVELGCGVGVLSAYFLAKGATDVLATDGEPGLEAFVIFNTARIPETLGVRPMGKLSFETLLWGTESQEKYKNSVDFLIASDVLYENEHIQILPAFARTLLSPKGEFWLCDPRRFRYEAALAELKKYFEIRAIHTVPLGSTDVTRAMGVVNSSSVLTHVDILKMVPLP